jgi:RND family efflux transporter MFP subunit
VELANADLEKTKTDLNSAISSYKIALDLAKNNLMLDTQSGDNDYQNSNLVNNVYDNIRNLLKSINNAIENSVDLADDILAINDKYSNDTYKNVLGAKNSSLIYIAKTSFYSTEKEKNNYLEKLENIDDLTNDEIKIFAENTNVLTNDIDKLLTNTTNLLNATVSSANFSKINLNNLKSSVTGAKAAINQIQSNLTSSVQALESSKTSFDAYQIAYKNAQNNLNNAQESAEKTITIKEGSYKQALATLNKVKANPRDVDIASIKAVISQSSALYNKSIIRAPFTGIISSMPFSEGDLIGAGQIVTGVVNKNGLQIKAYINPAERILTAVGNKVVIENNYQGIIANIAPSIDSQSKKIEIIIAISDEKANELTIGQYANIKITASDESAGSYIVPVSAVKIYNNKNTIFYIDENNIVKEKEVVVGDILGDSIEIKEGLHIEDKILSKVAGISLEEEVIIK